MTTAGRITAAGAGVGRRRLPRLAGRRLALLVLPLLGLLAWQLVDAVWDPRPWLLPSPLEVATAMADERSRLTHHALGTLGGAAAGFAVAAVAGAALAVAISLSRALRRAVYPWAVASQAVPLLAVAPVLAIWLGYSPARLVVAALVAVFPVIVTGVDGLRSADPDIARALRTLGASPARVWRSATLPAALPSLFSGLKMAAVFSVTGAVVAEYVGSDRGLGHLAEVAGAQFRTDLVFASIAALGLMGIVFFGAVAAAERLALPHRHRPARPRRRPR